VITNTHLVTLWNKPTSKIPGVKLNMLINNPVKFLDPGTKTPSELCATQVVNCTYFIKSRAITMTKHNKFTNKTPGAQLHMLSNIPVKFHDSVSNTFELSATRVEKCKCVRSQGQ
jgi:hypothetical protein